jgi:hypothetical protein
MAAATTHPAAIQRPPKTIHNRLSKKDKGDMRFRHAIRSDLE